MNTKTTRRKVEMMSVHVCVILGYKRMRGEVSRSESSLLGLETQDKEGRSLAGGIYLTLSCKQTAGPLICAVVCRFHNTPSKTRLNWI